MVLRLPDGRRFSLPRLLHMARNDLGMTQHELGAKLGVSRRTMIRWGRNQTVPAPFQIEELAALLRARDGSDLADSLLEAAELPIPEPPAPPAEAPAPPPAAPEPAAAPSGDLVDAVLFAAADAADLAPRKTRLVLRAALLRARELGVPPDALLEALGAAG